MEPVEQLLTVGAVARVLVFDPRTIQRMCESGELDATKIRGHWRISPASVRSLMPRSGTDSLPTFPGAGPDARGSTVTLARCCPGPQTQRSPVGAVTPSGDLEPAPGGQP